jgi:hypothetical protein
VSGDGVGVGVAGGVDQDGRELPDEPVQLVGAKTGGGTTEFLTGGDLSDVGRIGLLLR